jgi:hypothetical protein
VIHGDIHGKPGLETALMCRQPGLDRIVDKSVMKTTSGIENPA